MFAIKDGDHKAYVLYYYKSDPNPASITFYDLVTFAETNFGLTISDLGGGIDGYYDISKKYWIAGYGTHYGIGNFGT